MMHGGRTCIECANSRVGMCRDHWLLLEMCQLSLADSQRRVLIMATLNYLIDESQEKTE